MSAYLTKPSALRKGFFNKITATAVMLALVLVGGWVTLSPRKALAAGTVYNLTPSSACTLNDAFDAAIPTPWWVAVLLAQVTM